MDFIKIVGARQHNLKNITVEIPKNKLVVITGLSGSGKSSLAFDTIFAEGQRRYMESFSSYAQQILGVLQKPDVDIIEGISPTIAIDQRTAARNPRSTVGTMTEIYDFLRVLFTKIGAPHCYECGKPLERTSPHEITQAIAGVALAWSRPAELYLLAPKIKDKIGDHKDILAQARKARLRFARLDGEIKNIDEPITLDPAQKHTVEFVTGHLKLGEDTLSPDDFGEISRGVDKALQITGGVVLATRAGQIAGHTYSTHWICPEDHMQMEELHPRFFSFNNPQGACEDCQGLGVRLEIDPDLVLPNPRLTLAEGAVRPWTRTTGHNAGYMRSLVEASKRFGLDLDTPVGELPQPMLQLLLYGSSDGGFEGVISNLERRYRETDSEYLRSEIEKYMVERTCPTCEGQRLRREALAVTISGKSIIDIANLALSDALRFFLDLKLARDERSAAEPLLKEIVRRLTLLQEVGLSYLALDRNASTLAGGEAQRIRLATQISSQLTGIIYILDEPSIGLHARDTAKLLTTLKNLRDLGNSVIVVEHDLEVMRSSDHLIDVGPGAGQLGGEIVAQGTPAAVAQNVKSVTGRYLSGKSIIPRPRTLRTVKTPELVVYGARAFNLKNLTVRVPTGKFVCVTGVSGSGKSSFVTDILAKALSRHFHNAQAEPGEHDRIDGLEHLNKVIDIDQSPIGRTPRSNPATYTGVFTHIRDLYAALPEAIEKGLDAGKFSFNLRGGRCENCRGDGLISLEMHFLPDVYVTCDVCGGKRYTQDVLSVLYKGKSIADALDLNVDEALAFFGDIEGLNQKLEILSAVGLGYLKLGQPATTLSGGEAQRVKLAAELGRQYTGKTLYILDEPTTGLHPDDISRLLKVLQRLVDKGNTVLMVEHNLDVAKTADWVIDMGPEGGDAGGYIVAEGTPEEVAQSPKSLTGSYLKKLL